MLVSLLEGCPHGKGVSLERGFNSVGERALSFMSLAILQWCVKAASSSELDVFTKEEGDGRSESKPGRRKSIVVYEFGYSAVVREGRLF